jgi:hypothetical protein
MSIATSRVVEEVFPRRDIGIYCPVWQKRVHLRMGSIQRRANGQKVRAAWYMAFEIGTMTPRYIERVKKRVAIAVHERCLLLVSVGLVVGKGYANWWNRGLRISVGMAKIREIVLCNSTST